MTDYLPIGSVLISVICLALTVFLWRNLQFKVFEKLSLLDSQLSEGLDAVISDLEPIITTNSRAMGAISSLSDDTKMDKALERRIGQDLLGQNEDILEILQMAFPRVAEYIEERPEAVTKLMPRLNQLLSDPEARKRLNLGEGFKGGDLNKFWNTDNR